MIRIMADVDDGQGMRSMTWANFNHHLERANGSRCPDCDKPYMTTIWQGPNGIAKCQNGHKWKLPRNA